MENAVLEALYWDIHDGKVEAFHELVRQKCDLNLEVRGAVPLCRAVEGGHLELCRMLIDAGAAVNWQSSIGTSLLHEAVRLDSPDILRLLMDRGANIHVADKWRATLLHAAALWDHPLHCALLLDAGVNVNATDHIGDTPLHEAAEDGHAAVCEVLIARGADVEAQNERGESPLWQAAWRNRFEVCRMLVENGASPSAVPVPRVTHRDSSTGLTPFQEAVRNGHHELVRYFVLECGEDMVQKSVAGRTLEQIGAKHKMGALFKSIRTELAVKDAMAVHGHDAAQPAARKMGML